MSLVNFGLSDLVTVSQLALKVYRKCRNSSKEFATITTEVSSLRIIIDDIRLTIREHELEDEQRQSLLNIGQGCMETLRDLDTLFKKYDSLGSRHKRTWDRLSWSQDTVRDIRQRIISSTNLLTSLNTNLTRSSTVRIEALLKTFIQEYKNGQRPEDSIISVNTMRSVQEGNEDLWKQVASELEDAGITEEQVNQNKTTITEWIIKALSKSSVEHCSLVSLSFHTAREPGPTNSLTSTQSLNTASSIAVNEFPGLEFLGTLRWAKDVLAHLERIEENQEGSCPELLQEHILHLIAVMGNVQSSGAQDMTSLYYHEKVVRKDQMIPTLTQLSDSLKQVELFLNATSDGEDNSAQQHLSSEMDEEGNVDISIVDICDEMCKDTSTLEQVFSRMSSFFLCDLEDQLKILVRAVSNGDLSKGILESWDALASKLCDEGHLQMEEVNSHQTSVQSLLKVLIEEDERLEMTDLTEFGSEVLESSKSKPDSSLQSPGRGSFATGRTSFSDAVNNYSISGESGSTSKSVQSPVGAPAFQRLAVLFVDWADEVRAPMAHAYFNHLIENNVVLGNKFCRVTSAGLTARKPGVPLSPGVDFMLRDLGICENFQHTSRRLEVRDILNYEFILCLQTVHCDEVLAQFPTREEIATNDQTPTSNNITTREDIQSKVHLLGGFGDEQEREVTVPENIGGDYWFQVGRRRIYPGYERCFNDIRRYIHEFVFAITGIDVNELDTDIADTDDSREVSPEQSDNEEIGEGYFDAPNRPWDGPTEESPFDELEKAISTFQDNPLGNSEDNMLPDPDGNFSVFIQPEQHQAETDEQILHAHHEAYDRLLNLLLTDIGEDSPQSLRVMVKDWHEDQSRILLSVDTRNVRWVLQKSLTDGPGGCSFCTEQDIHSGLVLDHNLQVISNADAETLATYLAVAVHHGNQATTEEQAKQLEQIRDTVAPQPPAAPSIRDDVSVSVRQHPTRIAPDMADLRRKREAGRKPPIPQISEDPPNRLLPTYETDEPVAELPVRTKEGPIQAPIQKDIGRQLDSQPAMVTSTPPNGHLRKTKKADKKTNATTNTQILPPSTKRTSVMFLGANQTHIIHMAEVYLLSLIATNLALSCLIFDVVSAGVHPLQSNRKYNPKKLERLFKDKSISQYWPRKSERTIVAEDIVEFQYVLLLDGADPDALYRAWAEENPEEADNFKRAAKAGIDESKADEKHCQYPTVTDEPNAWKRFFEAKVLSLSDYSHVGGSEPTATLLDPIQPNQTSAFGVRYERFEKAYEQIKVAINNFLLREFKFDTEEMVFLATKDSS